MGSWCSVQEPQILEQEDQEIQNSQKQNKSLNLPKLIIIPIRNCDIPKKQPQLEQINIQSEGKVEEDILDIEMQLFFLQNQIEINGQKQQISFYKEEEESFQEQKITIQSNQLVQKVIGTSQKITIDSPFELTKASKESKQQPQVEFGQKSAYKLNENQVSFTSLMANKGKSPDEQKRVKDEETIKSQNLIRQKQSSVDSNKSKVLKSILRNKVTDQSKGKNSSMNYGQSSYSHKRQFNQKQQKAQSQETTKSVKFDPKIIRPKNEHFYC